MSVVDAILVDDRSASYSSPLSIPGAVLDYLLISVSFAMADDLLLLSLGLLKPVGSVAFSSFWRLLLLTLELWRVCVLFWPFRLSSYLDSY